jgi:hypothetical protein
VYSLTSLRSMDRVCASVKEPFKAFRKYGETAQSKSVYTVTSASASCKLTVFKLT